MQGPVVIAQPTESKSSVESQVGTVTKLKGCLLSKRETSFHGSGVRGSPPLRQILFTSSSKPLVYGL
jgi:hypothetical protein